MDFYKLGEVEEQFADIIWREEPVGSGALVALCEKELNWKKSTTYTVLRKLCEKKMFKNENSVVTSLITREEYNAMQSEQFVDSTFEGSLPAFIAAFAQRRKLTREELERIKSMIVEYEEEGK